MRTTNDARRAGAREAGRMRILGLNTGSSTVKYGLFDADTLAPLGHARAWRIDGSAVVADAGALAL